MIRGWGLWCLMPLSTIFQLFHGSYSDWWQYIYVVLEIVCLKILLLFSPKILHMPPDQDFTETGIRSRFHKDWHQIKASQRLAPNQGFRETGTRSRLHRDWHQIKASQRLAPDQGFTETAIACLVYWFLTLLN